MIYVLQFPKRLLSEKELEGLGISDGDTHLEGMKRYSQFDKFHSSLLKTPMATHLKGTLQCVHKLLSMESLYTQHHYYGYCKYVYVWK